MKMTRRGSPERPTHTRCGTTSHAAPAGIMRHVTTTPETPYVETVTVPVEDLVEWPGNARIHDDAALDASVDAHGQYRSVLGRRLPDGRIQLLAGHGTRAALQRRGRATVDVEIRDVPDDAAALKIVLQDNAASDRATYDDAALLALLDQAAPAGWDGTGWDQEGYLALLNDVGSENPFDGPGAASGGEGGGGRQCHPCRPVPCPPVRRP